MIKISGSAGKSLIVSAIKERYGDSCTVFSDDSIFFTDYVLSQGIFSEDTDSIVNVIKKQSGKQGEDGQLDFVIFYFSSPIEKNTLDVLSMLETAVRGFVLSFVVVGRDK